MKQAGATSYLVNGLGQRVKKSGATQTYFAYDEQGHLIGEYDAAGTVIQETLWLGDTPVAVVKPNTPSGFTVYNIWTDHLGTPRQITDTANISRWEWNHTDPFGNNAPNENPAGAGAFAYNIRFPGQYYDAETGLSYNYFRDYDAATGRYVESDPIGLAGGINTYGYVGGSPLSAADPTGQQIVCMPPLGCFPLPPPPVPAPGTGLGAGEGSPGRSLPDFELRDWWYLLFNDRSIPKPAKPACGCTCICRADANDNIPGNIKPGERTFAFGDATADSCAKATKEAKRIATRNLGKQPKHVPCRCSNQV